MGWIAGTGPALEPTEPSWLDRFAPPGDRETLLRGRLLARACFVAAGLWLVFGLVYLLSYGSSIACVLLGSVGLLSLLVPPILRRTGSFVVAGNLAAGLALGGLTTLAILRGGYPVNILMFALAIPATIAMMSPERWMIALWTALALALIVALFVANVTGHAPTPVVVLSDRQRLLAEVASLLGMLVYLLYVAVPLSRIRRRVAAERDALERRLEQAQRLEQLGQLAGGIAHDFRNVLVGVHGGADLLCSELDEDHPLYTDARMVLDAAERGTALTNQLMAFARRSEDRPELVDANEALERLVPLLSRLIGHGVAVELELGDVGESISIDPRQLDRVVLNLVVNARDAMPAGGTVTLRTAVVDIDSELARDYTDVPSGRYLRLEVNDTGCGMSDGIAARIFEPFFTTKGAGLGTGLGLSSCYGIVKQAGGGITVDSRVGEGTTFRVYLPMAGDGPRTETAPLGAHERILVVDDEPSIRRAIGKILEESGYRVTTAADGDEALAMLLRGRDSFDLVLADVVMPKLRGTALRDRLQAEPAAPPIICMSGHTSDEVEDLLAKPFTRAELLARIRASLAS